MRRPWASAPCPAADHVHSLQEIAGQSGANIVLGFGPYVRASQTDGVAQLSEGDLLDHMLDELLERVAGTQFVQDSSARSV